MNENELCLRTTVFGGFRKQDVLNYLEQSTQEYEAKLAALQKQLEEVQRAREGVGISLAVGEERQGQLEEENRRLAADLAGQERRAAEAEEQVAALKEQVAQLTEQLGRVSPAAEAYEGLKDRTAGIELEAHARAQEIEAEAEERAKKAQSELVAWVDKLQGAYGSLRAELDAALARAGEELKQVDAGLEGISREFSGQDAALEALRQSVAGLRGPKLPDPLPLEEEGTSVSDK